MKLLLINNYKYFGQRYKFSLYLSPNALFSLLGKVLNSLTYLHFSGLYFSAFENLYFFGGTLVTYYNIMKSIRG